MLPSASLQATTHPHFRLFLSPLDIGRFVFLYFLKTIRRKSNCLCRRFWIKVLSCALGGFYFSGKSGLFSVLGAVLTGISTILSDLFPDVVSQRRSITRMSPSEVRMITVVMVPSVSWA